MTRETYSIQILVFTNKVLLEHSQAHPLIYKIYGYFSATKWSQRLLTETTWPLRPKIFLI